MADQKAGNESEVAENQYTAHQQNRDNAIRAHELHASNKHLMFESAINFGEVTLKTTSLISAGSIVVLLAFVGSVYEQNSELALAVIKSIFWFFFSAVCSGASTGFAYLTQLYYAESLNQYIQTWEHPYIKESKKSKKSQRIGIAFHFTCVVFVILTYLFLLAGGFTALSALRSNVASTDGSVAVNVQTGDTVSPVILPPQGTALGTPEVVPPPAAR